MSADFDPTAFDINFDPTVQRMRGVAIHGNVPFDVPFMSEVADNLWVGGCENGLELPGFIDHVVSLYRWERYTQRRALTSFCEVTMFDSDEQPIDDAQIMALAAWVNVCRTTGPTLVHCQAGLNRSNLVAATALVLDGDVVVPLSWRYGRPSRAAPALPPGVP